MALLYIMCIHMNAQSSCLTMMFNTALMVGQVFLDCAAKAEQSLGAELSNVLLARCFPQVSRPEPSRLQVCFSTYRRKANGTRNLF